jgi:hypothetical protein
MSLRSLKIPGAQLGLGTFVNSDIDAHRKLIYHGEIAWTAANLNRTLTQGQTRMATIECVIIGRESGGASGSGSLFFTVGTISNGTVVIHNRDQTTGAGNTNKNAVTSSFWIVGSPDPQRIIV